MYHRTSNEFPTFWSTGSVLIGAPWLRSPIGDLGTCVGLLDAVGGDGLEGRGRGRREVVVLMGMTMLMLML